MFCATAIAAALTWTAIQRVHAAASDLDTYFPLLEWDRNYLDSATPESVGSGVTYWRDRDTYLLLDNTIVSGAARVLEFNRSHSLQRTISLVDFTDPEDIHLISGNTFVIAQEFRSGGASKDELVVIDIPTSGSSLNISAATRRLQIDSTFTSSHNAGIEAVAYLNGYFYFTTETATASPSSWRMWRLQNTGTGTLSVTPTDLFNVATLVSGKALDISGMATDGTDLWLLSDLGPTGGPRGRVIRCTIGGTLVADYELTSFPTTPTAVQWTQPEGIELFVDPDTGIMNLLITGEKGSGGVEFQRFTVPTVTITANDPTASETCLDPGTFQVTRTAGGYTSSSLNVTFNTPTGSATSGSDYSSLSGPASIAANALSGLVTISPTSGTP